MTGPRPFRPASQVTSRRLAGQDSGLLRILVRHPRLVIWGSGVNDLQNVRPTKCPLRRPRYAGQYRVPRLTPLPTLRNACLAVEEALDYLIMQGPSAVSACHLRPKTRPRSHHRSGLPDAQLVHLYSLCSPQQCHLRKAPHTPQRSLTPKDTEHEDRNRVGSWNRIAERKRQRLPYGGRRYIMPAGRVDETDISSR